MGKRTLRFGRCVVRLRSREVLLDEQPQALQPRPFDLLVYLIEHRDRVVAKDELLEALWPAQFVSPGVVARAVMKARQAIGDSDQAQALIKTVHRTGYRFVGALEPDAVEAPGAAQAADVQAALRVALLPFDNRTGQAELDWIRLGLLALVVTALAADARLSVVPIARLLVALDTVAKDAGAHEREKAVQRLLGARRVVQVAIARDGDRFALDYRIGPDGRADRLFGFELTELGERLARRLQALLCPPGATLPVAFDSADPLANQALARALQAAGEHQWPIALNLLRVVLDIEPGNKAVLLEQLRVLAALDDSAAFACGDELLAKAREAGLPGLAAAAHVALAEAYLHRRLIDEAKRHVDESLRLAGGKEAQDWVISSTLLRISIAINQLDFATAKTLLDRAEALCEASGNELHRVGVVTRRMVLEVKTGRMAAALPLAQQAVDLNAAHGLRSGLAIAVFNLANLSACLGHLGQAVERGREALAMARTGQAPMAPTLAVLLLCTVSRFRRRPGDIGAALAVLDGLDARTVPYNRAYRLWGEAHQAACLGRHDEAAARLDEACTLLHEAGQVLDHQQALAWRIVALIQAGRREDAAALCTEVQALPDLQSDLELQGALLHCRAQLAHGAGDVERARALLREACTIVPVGHWQAYACMDAAWLAIEAGDLAAAQALTGRIGPWLDEHPIGLALQARLLFARGQPARAVEVHGRCVASIEVELPAFLGRLGAAYAAAGAQGEAAPLPAAPQLPTLL